MRTCLPLLCATTVATSSTATTAYGSGNWAGLREAVTTASKDTVKDLLTPSVVPTRHFQRSLPKLPLPSLHDTLQAYLSVARPLCTPAQYEHAQKAACVFKAQDGTQLHEELRHTDKANPHTSFISSDIFEEDLKQRHALPLRSHRTWLIRPDEEKRDMLVRSAYWLWASVQFYKLYLDNEMEPELRYLVSSGDVQNDTVTDHYWRHDWFERTAALLPDFVSTPFVYGLSQGNVMPLDMSQFDCLFNCTRMPGVLQDEIKPVGYAPQITVQFRGHQFLITVADADCKSLSVDQLYAQLRDIVETAPTPPRTDVSVFTALPRTEWNGVRTMLLRNATNSRSMEAVEESMFVLNLDEAAEVDMLADPLCAVGVTAKTPSLRATNRWWDKSLSVSVDRCGAVSVSAEASWGDGVAVRRYLEDVYNLSHAAHSDLLRKDAPATYPVRQLQWHISSELDGVAQRAKSHLQRERQRLDVAAGVLDVPAPTLTGDAAAASLPHPSVEATVQLAAQLAWWRLQHRPTSCIETLDMHRYRRGRTEQVFCHSQESAQFVLSMLGSDVTAQKSACAAALASYHVSRRAVEKGRGIQCHLLGLRKTAERLLGRTPDLFRDPTYSLLSQGGVQVDVTDSKAAYGRGYGVNPFGYQLSCSRSGNSMLYQVSNLPSATCAVPSSSTFADAFSEACRDVYGLQN